MYYIPLEILKKQFNCSTEQELLAKKEGFREELQSVHLEQLRLELGIPDLTFTDVMYHLDALRDDATLVFHQWIDQSPNLKQSLLRKTVKNCDLRQQIVSQHFLFPAFRKFVSPFLASAVLGSLREDDFESYVQAATYLPLLSEADQVLIQTRFEKRLSELWTSLQTLLKPNLGEKEVIRHFASYFSDKQVHLLNHLTKSHYYLRINWINHAVEQLQYSGTTFRIAYWLTGQLKKLDLNPEHREQIREISDSIRLGDGKYFRKTNRLESGNSALRIILWLALFAAVFTGIFMVGYGAEWFGSESKEEMKTSFEQFTVAERQEIDSLMKTMEQRKTSGQNEVDPALNNLHMTPVALPIVDRDHFQNKLAQQFVNDCFKAMKLDESGRLDSCAVYDEKQLKRLNYPSFSDLLKHSGSQELYFRNASEYQVLVLVFDDLKTAKVYAALILPEEETRFQVNPRQRVLVLPGNNLGKFSSSAAKEDQPSSLYKHHFCFTDENFEHRLSSAYEVKKRTNKTCKLLANQSTEGEFYLIDVDEVLEE